MREIVRRGAGWRVPLTLALVAVLPSIAARGDLPDAVAIYWDTSGRPDGHAPPAPAVARAAVRGAATGTARVVEAAEALAAEARRLALSPDEVVALVEGVL
jgi:hypothetical protein